jgi:HD-GYP domain-containing protein (c-di-GMP phosphodiesterase class II)
MLSEKEKLESITSLGIELNQINDLDLLLERILSKARKWVNADAGSIYIREGKKLNFVYTQNDTLQSQLSEGEKQIYSTFTIPLDDKSIAGFVALTGQALNLSNVYSLPPDAPYHFSSEADDVSGYKTHTMLTVPLKTTEGYILGVLQIINAQDDNNEVIAFTKDDEKTMYYFAGIAAIAIDRAKLTRSIIMRMIKMTELHDPMETGAHANRVGSYSIEIYEKWAHRRKIPREEIDEKRDILKMAAMLHDVGKIAISDKILKKPGRLTEEEFEIMKQHTIQGWDGGGRGYPGHVEVKTGEPIAGKTSSNGVAKPKKGEEIPLFGRIVALADVYDALSSARCYKKTFDEEKVLRILKEETGRQFDPELVGILLEIFDTIKSIRERYASDN